MAISKTPKIQKATIKNNDIIFGNVITLAKMSHLEVEDLKNGISRVGGLRIPNYSIAYLKSAAILIEYGIENNVLDEIGIPAFFMQRHAVELLLKQVLTFLYEVSEHQVELKKHNHTPEDKEIKRLTKEHNLITLWNDLKRTSERMGFLSPPIELNKLIRDINQFEKTKVTFARYESSGNTQHLKNEIELPIVELQKKLELVLRITLGDESIITENEVNSTVGNTYMDKIYMEFMNCIREEQDE